MQRVSRGAVRRTLWALAGVAALLVAARATFAVQLSGGWDDVLDLSKPEASDAEVVAARQAGAELADAEIRRVVADLVTPTLGGGRVAADLAPTDLGASGCEVGQHNWKRDDEFDLICTESRRTVVAARRDGVPDDLAALDAALVGAGWRAEDGGGGLARTLEYWDQFAGTTHGDGEYGIEDLPSAGYRGADGVRLLLSFVEPDWFTDAPAPEAADDEYLLLVRVDHVSFAG